MNKRGVVLGIDTSNYTTSLAIVTLDGELVGSIRRLLPVAEGECGLRQSDALFAHTKNLSLVMSEAREYMYDYTPVAIGVSERPRNIEGSYMPVFLSGISVADSLSAMLSIPEYRFSHQSGHIMAALYSAGKFDLLDSIFPAFHISGGTTELVRVSPAEREPRAEIVGGTLDLNAGQVIDRIGVGLGMPFPAGRHLDAEAKKYTGKIDRKKISRRGMYVNLSGLENMAIKLYEDTSDAPRCAAFVFDYIARAVVEMALAYGEEYGSSPFVLAGGVMCNSYIRDYVSSHIEAYFAEPRFSSDNAVGTAYLARRQFLKQY